MSHNDIKFEFKLQSEKYIKFRQFLTVFFMFIPFICGAVVFAYTWWAEISYDLADNIRALAFVGFLSGTIIMGVGLLHYTQDEKNGEFYWSWLDENFCEGLLNLCNQHSDLNDYRLRVIAEGRMFTWGEYIEMTAWPKKKQALQEELLEQHRNKSMCKSLYESQI